MTGGYNTLLTGTPDYPDANFRSVQTASSFCMKRMQNDDFPEPLGPLTMHENGCLNLISSHMDGREVKTILFSVTRSICTQTGPTYCQLKKDFLNNLSSVSVIIETTLFPPSSYVCFFSAFIVTSPISVLSK